MSLDDLVVGIRYAGGTSADRMDKDTTSLDESTTAKVHMNDAKYEKKVTFARLLNKVSAEISSGSEVNVKLSMSKSLEIVAHVN